MNELQAIVQAVGTARQMGKEALLATVVGVRGSAYRRPGARMLITQEGWQAGSISGGCLESDVLRKAWWHTRTGASTVVTYDSTIDEDNTDDLSWGFGLGCNGVVEVLLERLTPDAPACPVAFIARCLEQNRAGIMATVVNVSRSPEEANGVAPGQRLMLDADGAVTVTLTDSRLAAQVERDAHRLLAESVGVATNESILTGQAARAEILLETITPPTPLVIFGAGHDAVPLASMAKALGWHVTVVDPRPGSLPRPDRFPGADSVLAVAPSDVSNRVRLDRRSLAVVMTHNVALDAAILRVLLGGNEVSARENPVRYIGVLGPRRRAERLLAGIGGEMGDHLHCPIGLDIGADAPETIALSILAEMQAVLAGRNGGFLRERDRPIHDPVTHITRQESPLSQRPHPKAIREPVVCAMATSASAA